MYRQWKDRFLAVMHRRNLEEEREFLSLVNQVAGNCTLDVARVLMKSFFAEPDYGTQEVVVRALASAERRDALRALIDELPRLRAEAPAWAEVLVGQEVDRHPELLLQTSNGASPEAIESLKALLADPGFRSLYPRSDSLEV